MCSDKRSGGGGTLSGCSGERVDGLGIGRAGDPWIQPAAAAPDADGGRAVAALRLRAAEPAHLDHALEEDE